MASEAGAVQGSQFGALGALMSGQAEGSALDTQASVARQNATLTREAGNANATKEQILGSQREGGIASAASASGVTESGSVLDVLHATAMNSELDRLKILHGADVHAINYENQASLDEMGARSARNASYLNAVSSIMMGGGKVFGAASGGKTNTGYGSDGSDDSNASGYGGGGDTAPAEGGGDTVPVASDSAAADVAL